MLEMSKEIEGGSWKEVRTELDGHHFVCVFVYTLYIYSSDNVNESRKKVD